MKTYNTYQEAKIANPKSEIYVHGGKFLPECDILPSHETYERRGYFKCHPKDYCMTLAEFFDVGHELVSGDAYLGPCGNVYIFGLTALRHYRSCSDSGRYILRAKALEQAEFDTTPQQVESLAGVDSEWKNGDACEHGHHNYSGANKMTYIGAHPFVNGKHVCLSELKGLVIVDSTWLSKPETPQQRQEREELEAAYELYCEFKGVDEIKPCSFDSFKESKVTRKQWIAVVRKTKYRKEAK